MTNPETPSIYLRKVQASDEKEFVKLMKVSQELHEPWISPPTSGSLFRHYLQRTTQADHEGFAVCLNATDEIAGAINVNNIVRGSFQSASLGYYVGAPFHGQGIMSQALKQLIKLACTSMGLHRLEANIQPDNIRSQNLVERCGFVREGVSKDFLYINGAWRDHVRWCYVDKRASLRAAGGEQELPRWKLI